LRKCDRLPRGEDSAGFDGRVDEGVAGGDVEVGGDGSDLGDLARGAQLVGKYVREADMPDQALLTQLGEGADLVFEGRVLRVPLCR
jgi:hypothetical protein